MKLRNVISPNPELMLAHTTPNITKETERERPTNTKLRIENTTFVATRSLPVSVSVRERVY